MPDAAASSAAGVASPDPVFSRQSSHHSSSSSSVASLASPSADFVTTVVPVAECPPASAAAPQRKTKKESSLALAVASKKGGARADDHFDPMDEDQKNKKRSHDASAEVGETAGMAGFATTKDPLDVLGKLPHEFQDRVTLLPPEQRSEGARLCLCELFNTLKPACQEEVNKKATLVQRVDVMMMHHDLQRAEAEGLA